MDTDSNALLKQKELELDTEITALAQSRKIENTEKETLILSFCTFLGSFEFDLTDQKIWGILGQNDEGKPAWRNFNLGF